MVASVAFLTATLVVPTACAAPLAQAQPTGLSPGAWFAFDYNIYLSNGVGNYSGYTEQTIESYRYTIQSVVGNNVTVYGHGTWTYSNNSGGNLAGGWTETFSFSSANRTYLWGFDVNGTYTNPSVWFWIPTPESVGSTVRILSSNYTVKSLDSDIWYGFPPAPRSGIQLEAFGSYLRTDEYGFFHANWQDDYWFAPSTGLVIAEQYTEHDSNSGGDGFEWQEQAFVTSSSYAIALDWVTILGVYAGVPATLLGALVGIRWYHRGPRKVATHGPTGPVRVTVRRVRKPAAYGGLPVASTSRYAEFLPTLIRRASLRRNPVWVASDGVRLVGAMIRDREAKVTTLYTQDTRLAGLFRTMNHSRDFFSELPPGAWNAKAGVAETFAVFELSPVRMVSEDTSDVRPMQSFDLPWVLDTASKVYWVPEPKWLSQAFADGDLGFTAMAVDGPVGFAFATIAGTSAFLHSLTVTPSARGAGLGRALTAARINALALFGIEHVLVEISVHNPASLAVAQGMGFRRVGEVTYYSRKVRRARPVERRPL